MFFPGTNIPKPTGLYKRPGTFWTRTRPRGALLCFTTDGASSFEPRDVYTGRRSTTVGASTAFNASVGGTGLRGSSSYFSIPTAQPTACSVEVVVVTDFAAPRGSLCSLNEGTTHGSTYDRQLYFDNGGAPVFHVFDGATKSAAGTALATGTLHHLCGTADGSFVRLYVDGALVASTAASNGGYTGYTNPCFMVDPSHLNPASNGPFAGHILLAQFASVAWSAHEVRERAARPYGHLFNNSDWMISMISVGTPAAAPVGALQTAVNMM